MKVKSLLLLHFQLFIHHSNKLLPAIPKKLSLNLWTLVFYCTLFHTCRIYILFCNFHFSVFFCKQQKRASLDRASMYLYWCWMMIQFFSIYICLEKNISIFPTHIWEKNEEKSIVCFCRLGMSRSIRIICLRVLETYIIQIQNR